MTKSMRARFFASSDYFRMNWQHLLYRKNSKKSEQYYNLNSQQLGSVAIVGAGPGDAELLTIKAYKALQSADIVLFDWLVDESVLRMIPTHVEKEFVGKRAGKHSMQQSDICKRILFHALAGKKVVRLKGGDPAIFARTVEETEALTQYNIPFCIIPGITSASGASAFTGIPLTHREYAQSVRFVTASLKNPASEPDWNALVLSSKNQTLVFYMGLRKLDVICTRLIANGLDSTFPVAVVDRACTPSQAIEIGSLASIPTKVAAAKFNGPSMIIIGNVVNHQQAVDVSMLSSASLSFKSI
jgi:uroporphyrin-III C-methyltransferase